MKISNFFKGIISLVISQVFIKIFGVLYTLYITNKSGFGDQGNAIYMSGYQIYALLLTISSIGVPNAISKIISEKRSIDDTINERRTFLIAIMLFSIIGFIGTIFLFFTSEFISNNILMIPDATLSIKVLSPAVFFVSINAVIRGYFNGRDKIQITAFSQFIEQFLKSIFTIAFVEIADKLTNQNTCIMAAAANFATTVATFISLILICNRYVSLSLKINVKFAYKKERILKIIKNILVISFPITISAILSSVGKNIDSVMIVRSLREILGEAEAIKKYGILSSKIDVLIALPLAFNAAISTSLVPEISKLKAKSNFDNIIKKVNFSLTLSFLIGVPFAFGISFYSKQIFELLFPNALDGSELLKLSSISVVFLLLTQTINGILQGIGKNNIPVIASCFGIATKILCNLFLVPISGIYEKGAIIGNVLSSFMSFIMVFYVMKKYIKIDINILIILIKSIFSSICMIFISYNIYNFFMDIAINKRVCIIISIIFSIIIYLIFILFMKIFDKNSMNKSIENTELQTLEYMKLLKNK